ncbi:hypothetical protein [Pseudoxanthomonas mexicana]
MIRLFLDSEWANDALRELVSLALISENGEHVFYAERDPLPGTPSSFVSKTVYPLLQRGPAAMEDQLMTEALRTFLQPLGQSEIFADAPLDFSMLNRVWMGSDRPPPPAPFRTRLAREGNLMQSVERYFKRNPEELARRHHALVDATALRAAWIVENYSFDGDVGNATSIDPGYEEWFIAKVGAAKEASLPSIPHEFAMEELRKRLKKMEDT